MFKSKSLQTNMMRIAGLGLAWVSSAVFAETLVVTTRDCGDGTPGKGADGWVSETSPVALKSKPGSGKMAAFIMIRCTDEKQDTGYLRFDLSGLKGKKVQTATLKLNFKGNDKDPIKVIGLNDGVAGANKAGSEDVNDHDDDMHDEFWSEKLLDRESAPGMLVSDGNPATVDWDKKSVVELGTFRNPGAPGEVTFSSAKLVELINGDSNGVVTIMLQGNVHSSQYASKECPEGLPAPALELSLAE